jgi:hypothetical protein
MFYVPWQTSIDLRWKVIQFYKEKFKEEKHYQNNLYFSDKVKMLKWKKAQNTLTLLIILFLYIILVIEISVFIQSANIIS